MKVLFIHPTGNKNSRVVLQSLSEQGFLDVYFTGFAVNSASLSRKFIPSSIKKFTRLRSYSNDVYIRTHQSRLAAIFQFIVSKFVHVNWINKFAVEYLFHSVDRRAYKYLKNTVNKPNLVIFHSGCGLQTAQLAQKLSIPVIMELPVAHIDFIQTTYHQLSLRYPDWISTLPLYASHEKSIELKYADTIVCPSKFVVDSIPSCIDQSKISLIRYGYDTRKPSCERSHIVHPKKKLRVLFVGQLTQRKGVADIFTVARGLNPDLFEFVFIGSHIMKTSFYRKQCPNAIFLSHLSRDEVLAQMNDSDVFLFPTYAEGRALVVLEALSSGLPVITTNNSGFDDINIHNNFGYIVQPGDCSLMSSLLLDIRRNPTILRTFKSNISHRLKSVCSWEDFSRDYLNLIGIIQS